MSEVHFDHHPQGAESFCTGKHAKRYQEDSGCRFSHDDLCIREKSLKRKWRDEISKNIIQAQGMNYQGVMLADT